MNAMESLRQWTAAVKQLLAPTHAHQCNALATIAYAMAVRGSLHPAHLLTLAFSDLFATNSPQFGYWGPPSFPWGPTGLILAQNMGELYCGGIPLIALFGFGMVRGWLWAREIRPRVRTADCARAWMNWPKPPGPGNFAT